jgi:hypothetical protein
MTTDSAEVRDQSVITGPKEQQQRLWDDSRRSLRPRINGDAVGAELIGPLQIAAAAGFEPVQSRSSRAVE